MITAIEAVAAARKHMNLLYANEKLQDVLLEEVERTDDEKFWLITFGFRAFAASVNQPERTRDMLFPGEFKRAELVKWPREYRLFHVDAHTGEVKSMTGRAA